MTLAPIDLTIVIGYLILVACVGLLFARKASRGLSDYFNAGRRMPWYLIGTSMAATTLAADTPLAVTELVRQGGLAGAWYGWSAAIGTVTAAVFFARLWRRTGIMTDAELVEVRYSGRPAAALRAIRAAYLAVPINCLILGWVIFAIVEIIEATMGVPGHFVLPFVLALAIGYSTAAGMWGVVATDALQMLVAVGGLICLAVFAVADAGGLPALQALPGDATAFVPSAGSELLPFEIFAVYLSVQWWATRNADGGEYIGLKLFSARSVADAQLGMVWFSVCEYVLKMWPLIIAALASLILYPSLASDHEAYPRMIAEHMPAGLRGLLVASLLAAFMSTVDTHLSWGASYLVNDLYKRFWRPNESEAHYVRASRMAMVLIGCLAAGVSLLLDSVADTWKLLLALGSGQGLVVILRWYWWRINAWSELSAMLASALFTVVAFNVWPDGDDYAMRLIFIVTGSTAVWLAATFAAGPEPRHVLERFIDRAKPRGGFWGPLGKGERRGLGRDFAAWLVGLVFVYSATFSVGMLLLGPRAVGGGLLVLAAVSAWGMLRLLRVDDES